MEQHLSSFQDQLNAVQDQADLLEEQRPINDDKFVHGSPADIALKAKFD
jgi:hypothetical protein